MARPGGGGRQASAFEGWGGAGPGEELRDRGGQSLSRSAGAPFGWGGRSAAAGGRVAARER